MNADSTKNLKSLIEGSHEGFQLGFVYFLELDHNLMGCFPAMTCSNETVLTRDSEVLSKIRETLEPRPSKITQCLGYINDKLGVVYLIRDTDDYYLTEISKPLSLFSKKKLEEMIGDVEFQTKDKPVFKWRPGLI